MYEWSPQRAINSYCTGLERKERCFMFQSHTRWDCCRLHNTGDRTRNTWRFLKWQCAEKYPAPFSSLMRIKLNWLMLMKSCLHFLQKSAGIVNSHPLLSYMKDVVGGRFDATQAFVGELSQFNMWDRVLRPVDIMGLANCSAYMPGNVVPWIDANVEVFGGASKAALEICEDRAFDS